MPICQEQPINSNSADISSSRFSFGLALILALAAIAYLSLAFFWGKFSRAEVFFAESAREMIMANNFITPLYHGQPFFDKPIFVYWLIIVMFKTFGINHLAARLPSVIASLITIFCTAKAAAHLYGRRTGLIAASMLASSFMYLSFSSLCMSDMFLVLFDTLSLIAIYAGTKIKEKRTLYWWLASVSMGFAFLTKGPVGVVLPAMASIIYLAITKHLKLIKIKYVLLALVTIAVVASPWFYAAYLANGTGALVYFFVRENLQRFAGETYDAHRPFWYMIVALFLGFAIWSILLPAAFIKFYRNWREDKAALFLWIWIFVAVGFFCFSRGKCDYYTMPAYPAAAILCAHYVYRWQTKHVPLFIGIASALLVFTASFAAITLPRINKLEPIDKYADLIKKGPDKLKIGMDSALSSWIDETLFQSGKDPEKLVDVDQATRFALQDSPFILIMPEDKYNKLPEEEKAKLQILSMDPVATHPLTPGYIISRRGNIVDAVPVVVATNIAALTKQNSNK